MRQAILLLLFGGSLASLADADELPVSLRVHDLPEGLEGLTADLRLWYRASTCVPLVNCTYSFSVMGSAASSDATKLATTVNLTGHGHGDVGAEFDLKTHIGRLPGLGSELDSIDITLAGKDLACGTTLQVERTGKRAESSPSPWGEHRSRIEGTTTYLAYYDPGCGRIANAQSRIAIIDLSEATRRIEIDIYGGPLPTVAIDAQTQRLAPYGWKEAGDHKWSYSHDGTELASWGQLSLVSGATVQIPIGVTTVPGVHGRSGVAALSGRHVEILAEDSDPAFSRSFVGAKDMVLSREEWKTAKERLRLSSTLTAQVSADGQSIVVHSKGTAGYFQLLLAPFDDGLPFARVTPLRVVVK